MNDKNLPAVLKTAISEQKIDLSQVNLMLPTQTFGEVLGIYDKVMIEIVTVDSDPKAGEVFEVTRGQKALGKVPIQKIGNALAVIWDPERTTILESTSTKARAKATGAIRKPNGEWIILTEEKTVDLEAIAEEQRMAKEEDAEKGPIIGWKTNDKGKSYPERGTWKDKEEKQDYIEREVRRAMLQYRKFKDERAMTGAKERVIKALIAIKGTYTDAELSKPFAFPRVLPDVNKMLANPAVRQSAIDRMVGAQQALFGPGQGNVERNVTAEPKALPEAEPKTLPEAEQPKEQEPEQPFADDIPFDEDPRDLVRRGLQHYLDNNDAVYSLPPEPIELIRNILAIENVTLEALQDCEKRIREYIARREQGNEKYAAHMKAMREAGRVVA